MSLRDLNILPQSVTTAHGAEFGLSRAGTRLRLAILAPTSSPIYSRFEGTTIQYQNETLLLGPTNPVNAAALRDCFPWLKPQVLGLRTSAGLGDRLGLATPGHVRAMRAVGDKLAPIFAQQSIREMARTNRTPQQVMDDAIWGVFQEGWRDGFGADADHLKTTADIDACAAVGYSFYTVDPGDHVDNSAATATPSDLETALTQLPWEALEDTPKGLIGRYLGQTVDVEGHAIHFDPLTLLRAAVKYGRAIAHVVMMYRHLAQVMRNHPWEFEVSVDETELPTSPAEHLFIAQELRRLGVQWVSLAPRYVGRFEKGTDYIGDLQLFEADFAIHAAIARQFGPYKLSLHSGSDKYSVYPIAMRQTRGLVHLKTAGTSYLEALHTIAEIDPAFFREIYTFARERYDTDKASYHVSAQLASAPLPGDVADADLPALLDQFDAREILHVTFGSVLTARHPDGRLRFYDDFVARLRAQPEAYAANLERHILRHLRLFVGQ